MSRSKWRPSCVRELLSRRSRPCEDARLAARDELEPAPPASACAWRSTETSSLVRPSWETGIELAGADDMAHESQSRER